MIASDEEPALCSSRSPGIRSETLPVSVDNTKLPYFPPFVGQYGLASCVSVSSIHQMMTHMTALARSWDVTDPNDFSNKSSWKWAHNFNNHGTNNGSAGCFNTAWPSLKWAGHNKYGQLTGLADGRQSFPH